MKCDHSISQIQGWFKPCFFLWECRLFLMGWESNGTNILSSLSAWYDWNMQITQQKLMMNPSTNQTNVLLIMPKSIHIFNLVFSLHVGWLDFLSWAHKICTSVILSFTASAKRYVGVVKVPLRWQLSEYDVLISSVTFRSIIRVFLEVNLSLINRSLYLASITEPTKQIQDLFFNWWS